MPDHFHLLILPTEFQHDMAAFEYDVREDFSQRVLSEPDAPALKPYRVREKSGTRGHRFWQWGRAYNEVVLTQKASIEKMRCCNHGAAQPASQPSPERWTNPITAKHLSVVWKTIKGRATATPQAHFQHAALAGTK